MIPKTIHYIWFGKNPKPEIVVKCIESWKLYMPDYEIIEWNEDNYDVFKNQYIKEAYNAKRWAFVSDYARFDILNQYGGIYFDTDVEVLKPFPKDLLNLRAFTGMESTNDIAPGLVFGCEPHFSFLLQILSDYEKSHFIIDGKENPITVNSRLTLMLEQCGYKKNGAKQTINDITIFPSEIFCGYDLDVFEPAITDNTISTHHYASTWAYNSFKVKRSLQKALKKIVGVNNYRSILMRIRKIRDK